MGGLILLPEFDSIVMGLIETPARHQPSVLILQADRESVEFIDLSERTYATPTRLARTLHFGAVPDIAAGYPDAPAVALVLPVDHVPRDASDPFSVIRNPERSDGYSVIVSMWAPRSKTATVVLTMTADSWEATRLTGEDEKRAWHLSMPLSFVYDDPADRVNPGGSLVRPSAGKSALRRFVDREQPAWSEQVAAIDPYLRRCTGVEQALVFEWLKLRHQIQESQDEPVFARLLERWRERSFLYLADDEEQLLLHPHAEQSAALIVGIADDLDTPNLGAMREGLRRLRQAAATEGLELSDSWAAGGASAMTVADHEALADLFDEGRRGQLDSVMSLHLRELLYVAECLHRGGTVLPNGQAPAFPADPLETITLLERLLPDIQHLWAAPSLTRQLPLRADRIFPLTAKAAARLARSMPDPEPELCEQLVREIATKRHYLLDHVSIVDIDAFGLRRVVLAPEERNGYEFHLEYLAEHELGFFAGSLSGELFVGANEHHTHLAAAGDDDPRVADGVDDDDAQRAVTAGAASDIMRFRYADDEQRILDGMSLLLLSLWRDLVVPRVRGEQYEATVERKAKGNGRRERAARKGNVEVVRYLPRRIVLRRAEEQARKERGQDAPLRQVYKVGAYAMRLAEGKHRTYEADEYAREIGMPLAPWQTVVKPHARGGTDEEKRAAMEEGEDATRHWRSWSAVDILRSRGTTAVPVA